MGIVIARVIVHVFINRVDSKVYWSRDKYDESVTPVVYFYLYPFTIIVRVIQLRRLLHRVLTQVSFSFMLFFLLLMIEVSSCWIYLWYNTCLRNYFSYCTDRIYITVMIHVNDMYFIFSIIKNVLYVRLCLRVQHQCVFITFIGFTQEKMWKPLNQCIDVCT